MSEQENLGSSPDHCTANAAAETPPHDDMLVRHRKGVAEMDNAERQALRAILGEALANQAKVDAEMRATLAHQNYSAQLRRADKAEAERDTLKARVAELEADAARYRQLRILGCAVYGHPNLSADSRVSRFTNLDEVIDAALSRAKAMGVKT